MQLLYLRTELKGLLKDYGPALARRAQWNDTPLLQWNGAPLVWEYPRRNGFEEIGLDRIDDAEGRIDSILKDSGDQLRAALPDWNALNLAVHGLDNKIRQVAKAETTVANLKNAEHESAKQVLDSYFVCANELRRTGERKGLSFPELEWFFDEESASRTRFSEANPPTFDSTERDRSLVLAAAEYLRTARKDVAVLLAEPERVQSITRELKLRRFSYLAAATSLAKALAVAKPSPSPGRTQSGDSRFLRADLRGAQRISWTLQPLVYRPGDRAVYIPVQRGRRIEPPKINRGVVRRPPPDFDPPRPPRPEPPRGREERKAQDDFNRKRDLAAGSGPPREAPNGKLRSEFQKNPEAMKLWDDFVAGSKVEGEAIRRAFGYDAYTPETLPDRFDLHGGLDRGGSLSPRGVLESLLSRLEPPESPSRPKPPEVRYVNAEDTSVLPLTVDAPAGEHILRRGRSGDGSYEIHDHSFVKSLVRDLTDPKTEFAYYFKTESEGVPAIWFYTARGAMAYAEFRGAPPERWSGPSWSARLVLQAEQRGRARPSRVVLFKGPAETEQNGVRVDPVRTSMRDWENPMWGTPRTKGDAEAEPSIPVYWTRDARRAKGNLERIDKQDPIHARDVEIMEGADIAQLWFTPQRGDHSKVVALVAENTPEFRDQLARAARAKKLVNKQVALVMCGTDAGELEKLKEILIQNGASMVWAPDRQITETGARRLVQRVRELLNREPADQHPDTIDELMFRTLEVWRTEEPGDPDLVDFGFSFSMVFRVQPTRARGDG